MKKIGIIGAMEEEIELLKHYFEGKIVKKCGLIVYDGKIFGKAIVFARAGIAKVNASLCTQVLISNFHAELIINCGIAGAISPHLSILDLVVSDRAFQHDVDATYFHYALGHIPGMKSIFWDACGELIQAAFAAFETVRHGNFDFDRKNIFENFPDLVNDLLKSKMVKGTVASGDVFVSETKDRNRIKMICPETACVEMEGAAIAQVASINEIPFVILRSISDSADAGNALEMTYEKFSERAAYMAAAIILQMISSF